MDFAALVRAAGGRMRQVLIEIQKAKAPTVARRCLGGQLADGGSLAGDPEGRRAPIVAIYCLGYDRGLSEEPVIDVCPDVRERHTGRKLDAGHPFLASLHHRSRVWRSAAGTSWSASFRSSTRPRRRATTTF